MSEYLEGRSNGFKILKMVVTDISQMTHGRALLFQLFQDFKKARVKRENKIKQTRDLTSLWIGRKADMSMFQETRRK